VDGRKPLRRTTNGFDLLMAAIAYVLLQNRIIASQGENPILKKAVGSDWKGKSSPIIYLIATVIAFWLPWLAQGLYVLITLLWLVSDRRIETALAQNNQ
jgi:uncharacterized membrane protein